MLSRATTDADPAFAFRARRTLLLSVHPDHAESIILGRKRFELRRVRPTIGPLDTLWVYSTMPQAALLGGGLVARVHHERIGVLWRRVRLSCGVSRTAFRQYFAGLESGYAIEIDAPVALRQPIALTELRRRVPGFTPPRSYWYLDRARSRDAHLLRLLEPVARTLARDEPPHHRHPSAGSTRRV